MGAVYTSALNTSYKNEKKKLKAAESEKTLWPKTFAQPSAFTMMTSLL